MNSGDTAWLLASSALVMQLVPGMAFLYGGVVRSTRVLIMMRMSFLALAIGPEIVWLVGYGLTFAEHLGDGLRGGCEA